ncbi:MAG TPA: calcium-binding protein, partial [Mycoplana sp.]|nr:calcium-binding protein [Mycoplana sp.]
ISIEQIRGTRNNDDITGSNESNRLRGDSGQDTINGLDGNDRLEGGNGDDQLVGGAGSDTLVGGDGFDLVDYSQDELTDGVTVDLVRGSAWAGLSPLPPESGDIDTLVSIEDILGTRHADRLIGTAFGEESFFAGLGNDTISGGKGLTPEGFQAIDTLNYHRLFAEDIASKGITVTFDANVAGSGTVTFNDGNGGINAEAGIDTFDGIERVRGTIGNDLFTGGAGSQSFRGLAGNDTFSGGAGYDQVDFRRDPVSESSGIDIDLGAGTATGAQSGTDTLISIEEVRGSLGADTVKGSSSNDNIRGEDGDDEVDGGAGHDSLSGDSGADTLNGGTGFDTLNGGAGNDILIGGIALKGDEDWFEGSFGDDEIHGGIVGRTTIPVRIIGMKSTTTRKTSRASR